MEYEFERFLLESQVANLYREIKEYSINSLNLPMRERKTYVGFGNSSGFFLYFIGLNSGKLIFSSRVTYFKVMGDSNIVRLSFIEENREKIFECIDRIYKDYLEKTGTKINNEKDEEPKSSHAFEIVKTSQATYTKRDLDVVLPTPIEELVPQMIAFNNDELMEKVENYLKKYEERHYDESAIRLAKDDRKSLNFLSKKLNDERLRIGKIYKAPYERFKQQVDEIINRIAQVSEKIDVQIKAYESEEKRVKTEKIKSYFESVFNEFGELISYESIHEDRWLKPSVKLLDVYSEINRIHEQIKNDVLLIESLQSEDENLIKNYYFRTLDIDRALQEAEKYKKARQAIEKLNAARVSVQQNVSIPYKHEPPQAALVSPQSDTLSKADTNLHSVALTVEGTDSQISALKSYLLSSGMKFIVTDHSETSDRKFENNDEIESVSENKIDEIKIVEDNEIKKEATKILKQLFGSNATFRPGQYEAIEATFTHKRTLIVQRTGWGKSMVYFTATKLLRNIGRGVTIVVSPLLSLMENQMESAIRLNLNCESFNSALKGERRVAALSNMKADKYDLIFVTPETLFSEDVNVALRNTRIGLFVIDEAHCISDWGHDFRLDYSNLYRIIGGMSSDVPVLATTATANNRVIADIKKQFGNDVFVSRGSLTRESLIVQVLKLDDRAARCAWILKNINSFPGTGIIYCLTHSDCERLSEFLVHNGIDVMPYYSGDEDVENTNAIALEKFKNNQLKALVATVKLGMGYDKGDIGFVIHYQMPPNIVSYYQQIGRAGRNIDKAYAILLCGEEDNDIHEYFINEAFPTREECYSIISAIEQEGGSSLYSLERKVNIFYRRLEKAVGFLVHEEALYREGDKYFLTPKKFIYDEQHYNEITEQRKKEYEQMKELVRTKTCYSKFIANCLDDFTARDCGKCVNCTGKEPLSNRVGSIDRDSALHYLENSVIEIKPLGKWASSHVTGQTYIDKYNEVGICLSKYNDAGYGALVKKGKYVDNEFCLRLVERSAEVLKPIISQYEIRHICCVPSLRSNIVKNFTIKLAERLGIKFIDCLVKSPADPQKSMQNSEHQCRNAWNSFSVAKCEIPSKLILVDDIVDSKWTITVCGYKLMQKGANFVFPFALADSGRR